MLTTDQNVISQTIILISWAEMCSVQNWNERTIFCYRISFKNWLFFELWHLRVKSWNYSPRQVKNALDMVDISFSKNHNDIRDIKLDFYNTFHGMHLKVPVNKKVTHSKCPTLNRKENREYKVFNWANKRNAKKKERKQTGIYLLTIIVSFVIISNCCSCSNNEPDSNGSTSHPVELNFTLVFPDQR